MRYIAFMLLVLALAGCGSSASTSTAPPSLAGATTAAAAVPPLPVDVQRAICANLDALFITDGGSAVTNGVPLQMTMQQATQAQVVAAVGAQCPNLSQFMP
jgi:hypothetical protein